MFSAAYRAGLKQGRRAALRIEGIRSLSSALAEEVDSRQDALTMEFVEKMNAGNNSSVLWNTYESGVRDGIRQIMEDGE